MQTLFGLVTHSSPTNVCFNENSLPFTEADQSQAVCHFSESGTLTPVSFRTKRATQGHFMGPKEEAQVVGPWIFNDLAALVPPLRTDSVHTLLCASSLSGNFRCRFIPQSFAPLSSSLGVKFDVSSQKK